jgi:hypothetical protein
MKAAGRRKSRGTLKQQIITLRKAYPTMSPTVIAERVGTRPNYVCTVVNKCGFKRGQHRIK